MIKKCKVLLHNAYCTVFEWKDGTVVQITPPADTIYGKDVYVQLSNGKYSVVDKNATEKSAEKVSTEKPKAKATEEEKATAEAE